MADKFFELSTAFIFLTLELEHFQKDRVKIQFLDENNTGKLTI